MLWRLPWIIGKSPLSISVYLYVWYIIYVRQSSSVDSPLASPWRQSSKIFHSDNKRRLYSAFLFSNVDTTATHTHDWILSQGPENIPSWNWAIYERPFFHHLNCHPHSINSSFRRQHSWDGGGKLQLRGDIGADHPRGGQPHQLLCVGQFCLFYFPLRPMCLGAQHKISFYQV